MIEKQKTTFMRLGLGLAGVVVDDATAEKIWRIYEDLTFKKGDFSQLFDPAFTGTLNRKWP